MGKLKLRLPAITAGGSLFGLFLFALVASLACQPVISSPTVPTPVPTLSGTRLAFETIEQRDSPGTGHPYGGSQPGLAVIAGPDDLNREPLHVSPETIEALARFDFDRYFALIAYQGGKPSTGFGGAIREIVIKDGQVTLLADLREPAPDEPTGKEGTKCTKVIIRIPSS